MQTGMQMDLILNKGTIDLYPWTFGKTHFWKTYLKAQFYLLNVGLKSGICKIMAFKEGDI